MKQMLVMRTDLNMRKGKMVAQGAHASLGAVLPFAEAYGHNRYEDCSVFGRHPIYLRQLACVKEWLASSFKKVTVRVESEEQLLAIHQAAKAAGLIECLITDSGLTEFNGVPTITCCAIGPDTNENLDPITGELKLL